MYSYEDRIRASKLYIKLGKRIKTRSDIARMHGFLAAVYQPTSARTLQQLATVQIPLLANLRIGERLEGFEPRYFTAHGHLRVILNDLEVYFKPVAIHNSVSSIGRFESG